jgi:hypothetical protein
MWKYISARFIEVKRTTPPPKFRDLFADSRSWQRRTDVA